MGSNIVQRALNSSHRLIRSHSLMENTETPIYVNKRTYLNAKVSHVQSYLMTKSSCSSSLVYKWEDSRDTLSRERKFSLRMISATFLKKRVLSGIISELIRENAEERDYF